MDPLIILLLVIIGLAGGGIGVLADHLGRKIGKKKLSFRSMRPKHVARLGTFIAGMLVSTVTIILVFFTSSDVREWIIRGRQAIKTAKTLTVRNSELLSEIASETSQIGQLNEEGKNARKRLEDAQGRLNAVQTQLATAKQRFEDASRKVEQGKLALAKNQDLLRRNKAVLASRQAALARVASNLKAAEARYADLQHNFKAVDRERTEANNEVLSLKMQANTLTTEISQLRRDSAQLTKDKDEARLALESARTDLTNEQAELKEVEGSLKAARDALDTAHMSATLFAQIAGTTRQKPIVFQFGQEIQRLQVGANLSETQARQALRKLMTEADRVAREHGAATAPGSLLSVFFLPFRNGSGAEQDPKAVEEAIVAGITGQDHEVVLIARAFVNTFKEEGVPLDISFPPNPVVYHKDEILGELRVGRNWPRAKVLTEFTDFMRQQVRDKIKDKMIPVAGQEDSLIDVAPEKTLDVVEHLARATRSTILQVTAHAETRAADSLQLDFKFK